MKFIGRWLFRLAILAILLVIAALALKDVLLKELVEARLRRATGLEVQIGRFEADLLAPVVRMEDFRLYSTAEFGGSPLLTAPVVQVEYDRGACWRGIFYLSLLRLHIAQLDLVEDGSGRTNLRALREQLGRSAANESGAWLRFGGIKTLNLTLDRIRVRNLRALDRTVEVDPGIRGEIIRNLASLEHLDLLLGQVAARAGIGPLPPVNSGANPQRNLKPGSSIASPAPPAVQPAP